jgi:hypothetical protein
MIRAMRTHPRWTLHAPRQHRRLAWLLVLALLLPFAQALAWTHAISHHSVRIDSGATSSLDSPCATCLGAAPLHAGALPSAPPVLAEPPLQQSPPPALHEAARPAEAPLPYHSRAPPRFS